MTTPPPTPTVMSASWSGLRLTIMNLLQGEHGVGLGKRDYLPHELGVTTVDAMRKVRYIMLILSSYSSPTHLSSSSSILMPY